MSKQGLTKQQIIDWATDRGWRLDKWGHLQKEYDSKQYRFKLSNIALRYELKVRFDTTGSGWVRLSSAYYKDLSIVDGKLHGLKRGI